MKKEDIAGTTIDDFKCCVVYKNLFDIKTPTYLEIEQISKNKTVLSITLDAADLMIFIKIDLPDEFIASQKENILKSLQLGIKKYGGGKCLALTTDNLVAISQQHINIGTKPVLPAEREHMLNKILFLLYDKKAQENIVNIKQKEADAVKAIPENYLLYTNQTEQNRQFLTTKSNAIARLFNEHTTWGKKPSYRPMGIAHRINNPNVIFYALLYQDEKEGLIPVCCCRMHNYTPIFYVGDLVTHTDHRRHNLSKYIMQAISNDITTDSLICTIAGGDQHALDFYLRLGFKPMVNYHLQGGVWFNNYVLLSGIIEPESQDNILTQYQQLLGTTAAPVLTTMSKDCWSPGFHKKQPEPEQEEIVTPVAAIDHAAPPSLQPQT